ncbi:hypothetical protein [Natronomonas marina]|jgi:hypothetical protein|uniref:hypothetical protein n=1 Tax=Natronomonas marina TaxID=2961939 RepID=UPI0020C94E89|nr:hypothetical protein [Natronomonas marina]
MSAPGGRATPTLLRSGLGIAVLGVLAGALSTVGGFLPLLLEGPPGRIRSAAAALSVVLFLVAPVGVLLVGYWTGRRLDVGETWARVAGTFGVVGAVASFAAAFLVTTFAPVAPMRGPGGGGSAVAVNSVLRGVRFALAGLAGAAVAQFRAG